MGRGRVQLKRIENKISRQVTFSKRRTGLLKKAHEISVLCDADVALIVFSTKGKLFEFSTDSCMESILERYERYTYTERQLVATETHQLQGTWSLEYPKLVARIEVLQRNIRNLTGEELDPLSLRELQYLEQQLDTALKRIRTRKNQLMHESISQLQKKEKALQEQNNMLSKKMKENEKVMTESGQLEQQTLAPTTSSFMLQPTLPLPSLTIGLQEAEQFLDESKQHVPDEAGTWRSRTRGEIPSPTGQHAHAALDDTPFERVEIETDNILLNISF